MAAFRTQIHVCDIVTSPRRACKEMKEGWAQGL